MSMERIFSRKQIILELVSDKEVSSAANYIPVSGTQQRTGPSSPMPPARLSRPTSGCSQHSLGVLNGNAFSTPFRYKRLCATVPMLSNAYHRDGRCNQFGCDFPAVLDAAAELRVSSRPQRTP